METGAANVMRRYNTSGSSDGAMGKQEHDHVA